MFGIEDQEESAANWILRQIFIAPITHRGYCTRYAIALHEIGHIVTKSEQQPLLYREGLAWQWARRAAIFWGPRMDSAREKGLLGYLERALLEHNCATRSRPVRLPPADHPFWDGIRHTKLAKQILGTPTPEWLSNTHPAIPWRTILTHPTRPRCENCSYWNALAESEKSETPEKLVVGECTHTHRPLGTEMTPGGAFCGSSWVRR